MRKNNGLTLIELMVTLAVAGIVLGLGVPSLNQFMKDSELINVSNRVAGMVTFARSEAAKRNDQTIVCRSANNSTCSATGGNLVVLTDSNGDGTFELLKSTSLIGSGSDIHLYFQSLTSDRITFSTVGMPIETGSIEICDDRGTAHAKASVLNRGGQLRQIVDAERGTLSCS